MYGGSTADPRITPDDHNLELLKHSTGILNEHIAVFEQVCGSRAAEQQSSRAAEQQSSSDGKLI
jgi:hypothetical protein